MEVVFNQHIGIFKNAVPKDWCNNLINIFEENLDKAYTREREGRLPTETEDIYFSLQSIEEGKYIPLCNTFINNFWKSIYPIYEKKYKFKDVLNPYLFLYDFKLQKTQPSEGYHVWHMENNAFTYSTLNRVMVYTLYLNDVEEGGETEFLIQGERVKPEQGTLCIFPAYYTHLHRGNPPLSGEKYIMTGWISHHSNPQQQTQ